MFPWIWLWAPQVRWPFSGDVAQDIEPNTAWLFGAIKPGAGDARIERQAYELASYGKQLGWITEVLIEVAEGLPGGVMQHAHALDQLKALRDKIEALKQPEYDRQLAEARAAVARLEARGPRCRP